MTKETIVAALLAAAFAGAHAETFVDRARVLGAEPQYETVQVPREECGSQWVTEQRAANGTNVGGAVIGGITGGIVGNQVGKGHGREAATALGAVVGALAGNNIAQRGDAPVYEQREVRSCRTVSDVQQRLAGYRVTYEYRGMQSTVVMPEQPGPTLAVRVSVEPEYHRR